MTLLGADPGAYGPPAGGPNAYKLPCFCVVRAPQSGLIKFNINLFLYNFYAIFNIFYKFFCSIFNCFCL